MCVISKSSMARGIHKVASGRSKVSINSHEATGRVNTPFGVHTVKVSRDRVVSAGCKVLKSHS